MRHLRKRVHGSGGRAWMRTLSNGRGSSTCRGRLLRRWVRFSELPKARWGGTSTVVVCRRPSAVSRRSYFTWRMIISVPHSVGTPECRDEVRTVTDIDAALKNELLARAMLAIASETGDTVTGRLVRSFGPSETVRLGAETEASNRAPYSCKAAVPRPPHC